MHVETHVMASQFVDVDVVVGLEPETGAILTLGGLGPGSNYILCYAKERPVRKSGFRAGFRPDSCWENINIGSPASLQPAGGPILRLSRLESGRNLLRKFAFRPRSTIA